MKKLDNDYDVSIIILFCDRDYMYIAELLNQIMVKVRCLKEVILVDNRELTKSIEIPEIKQFSILFESAFKYIDNNGNLAQLMSKKLALAEATGKYVWFIDADDELQDIISPTICRYNEEIIDFNNYVISCSSTVKRAWLDYRFFKSKKIYPRKYRNYGYLYSGCCCWNKWFRRDFITKIYDFIEFSNTKVSAGEDVFIVAASLASAKSVRNDPTCIYTYRADRSLSSARKINTLQEFEATLQGLEFTDNLYKRFFKNKKTKLYSWDSLLLNHVVYYLLKIAKSDDSLAKDEFDLLHKKISKHEILRAITGNYPEIERRFEASNVSLQKFLGKYKDFIY